MPALNTIVRFAVEYLAMQKNKQYLDSWQIIEWRCFRYHRKNSTGLLNQNNYYEQNRVDARRIWKTVRN